jgi:hypothetical protein
MSPKAIVIVCAALSALLVPLRSYASCATECGNGVNAASCGQSCVDCRVDYQDGSCPPDQSTWMTCADYWGCCQDWRAVQSTLIGKGAHGHGLICIFHDTVNVTYQDFGDCHYGQMTICEEHDTYPQPNGTCCIGRDSCWGREQCF